MVGVLFFCYTDEMNFEVPEAAKLDPEVRKALAAMKTGVDPEAVKLLMPHLVDTKVAEADAARMKAAREWTAKNADCLTCGLCCQQGWRVDVRATDLPRMSPETKSRMVLPPPTGAPTHVIGVLRIIGSPTMSNGSRCAAQTTHEGAGCDIYEERPETCRTFDVGHERCVVLRAERGLPFEPTGAV